MMWWSQSLPKFFSRTCRDPICTSALSARRDSPQGWECFYTTRVHGCRSPKVVHFKGSTCPRCKSLFATEKSANDHYRRNLKRKFCARPRGPDTSNVPPRRVAPSPPKNRGKGGKRLLMQQTLFGVFGFEAQGDRRQKRGLTCPRRGAGARGGREQAANHYQSQNPGKGKPHPTGPRRVTSAAGLLNAVPIINLAKADQQQQIIIERQDKLLAIVNKPSIARQKEMLGQMLKMYTTSEHLLTEIAACVWFKTKSEKYLLSLAIHTWSPLHQVWDYIHTALLCVGAKLQDGPPPRGPKVRAPQWAPTGPCGP